MIDYIPLSDNAARQSIDSATIFKNSFGSAPKHAIT